MLPIQKLSRLLRAYLTTAALASGLVFAQGPAQGTPGTPKPDGPRQGAGGGMGLGISIDLGSVINLIKTVTQKDTQKDEQEKPPVLQKKAVAVSSGSSGNYTIDWVVQYANNTGAPLPSAVVKDGPIATIIPGSLQQPPGWSGTTNASPPVDNFALWTGTNVAPHGVMTAAVPAAGPASMNLTGSGDGYQPIPYTRTAAPAGKRVYIMNHHLAPGALLFKCLDVSTGTDCAGWAGGKALPMGNGTGNASATLTNSSEYVISNGKFYYAAISNTTSGLGFGIGCYDLETDTQCGYAKMDNRAVGLYANGPWQIGNELYVASYDGFVYCAKLAPGLPACQGSGYQIPATTIKLNVERGTVEDLNVSKLAGKVVGTKLYLTSLKGAKYINCYDTITKNACWATTAPTKGTASYSHSQMRGNYTNYLYYSNALVPMAICSQINDPAGQFCVNLADGNAYVAAPMTWASSNPVVGLETYYQGKTYFVNFNDNTSNGAFCWDWASASNCTTKPDGMVAAPPKANTKHYGLAADDQGCVWAYGHEGVLWNFNPGNVDPVTKLAKPCGGDSGKAQLTLQPLTYCSGPKPFHWTSVEIKGAPLANYDKFIIKVLDSTNNSVLLTKDLKATGQLLTSITGIDAQTLSKPLKIELEYVPKPGTGASDKPTLEVRYNAPPQEFCFKSTHTCEQTKITNTVETPDAATPGNYITVKVDVDKPQNCTVKPPPPVCGQPGQPACPCGTANTPACPVECGQPGQPACPSALCGQPGQPRCPDPFCIPGTPGCPVIGIGCAPGDPLCNPVRPPPPKPVCLTGDCAPKAEQSTGQEFKEPKVSCVRKPKPVEEAPKKVAPKPKPRPVVAAAPAAPVDADAPPKPKPKPKPRAAQPKPAAHNDDCE